MANVIKIKRGAGAPTTSAQLAPGEIGFNTTNDSLYINKGTDIAPDIVRFGQDGRDGSDGKGIVSTDVAYASHTNGTTAPTTGWQISPAPVKGQYLWTRVTTTYSDGSTIPTYSVAYQATDGQAGKGISSTSVEYAQTASGTTTPTSWSGTMPDPIKGQYLWSKTTIIYTDATSSVAYSTGYTATDGQRGPATYIWVKYADTVTGTGMSDSPIGKKYMGLAFNKSTETESDIPGDYKWILIEGPQGIQGPPGEDGAPTYTWIRYADTASGEGISNSPTGKEYIGLAHNKDTATESNTPSDYTWSLIRGPQGNQGVEGPKGDDGVTTYTWIKYSPNADGSGLTDTPQANTEYIGIAPNKTISNESNTPSDYTWGLFKGPKGDQGIQGPKGDNGTSQYVYIRYSANSNGNPMTTSPQATTKYIGLANTTSSTAPTGYESYTWSLIKGSDGEQGPQGIQGPAGDNGQPTYTWVKYADTPTSGMDDYPDGKKYIGLAFNKTTPTESTSYGAYQWSLMPQNLRVGGRNLLLGSGERVSNEHHSIAHYDLTDDIQEGEYVTLTIWGSLAPTKSYFEAEMFGNPAGFGALTDNGDGTYSNTFEWWGPTDNLFLIYVYPDTQTGISTINKIKLEKGNTATDWTPAPEDIDAKFSEHDVKFNEQDTALADLTTISQTNTSLINQTNDAITSLVSQEVYQTSLDGLREELEDYVGYEVDTRITTYSTEVNQNFENITFAFDKVTNNIRDLGNELQSSLDEVSTYIRFDINGIELGKLNSDITLFIENDRISFKQNDVEVAYINNNRLYITDGQFLNSLRLGNFAFTPRDNGNLSFGRVM